MRAPTDLPTDPPPDLRRPGAGTSSGPDAPPCWPVELADGQRFEAAPDQDLVSAARAAGLRLPRSCRNGSCRACRCRLLEGEIRHRIEWPGLSREELAEGWILPCVALPRSALRLDLRAEPAPPAGR